MPSRARRDCGPPHPCRKKQRGFPKASRLAWGSSASKVAAFLTRCSTRPTQRRLDCMIVYHTSVCCDFLLEPTSADQQLQKGTCLQSHFGYLRLLMFLPKDCPEHETNRKPTSAQHRKASTRHSSGTWHGQSLTGNTTENSEPVGVHSGMCQNLPRLSRPAHPPVGYRPL